MVCGLQNCKNPGHEIQTFFYIEPLHTVFEYDVKYD